MPPEGPTSSPVEVWVVVLIKGFDEAKQRLRPALGPAQRRELAERNARLALAAAGAGDRVLAVCGSEAAARLAGDAGAEVLLEDRPGGQNLAARRGIEHARTGGAGAVLLLSSDLPLVSRGTIASMLAAARRMEGPVAMAAPAVGRGGTNALYLRPPDALGLHFGDDSLEKFARDAADRGVRFELYESPDLALDLDEPADLEELRRLAG
ncbi:MAG TPA: 2-phospho-L-lactate guanylyltransferase [Candidatus Dormibacteraeota bacterium]|nr:2-phospho-L-lactate guanylyltransferase [Candidatus Dormibacteraeota bacterium]